jgi:hypothetical protein
MRAMMDLEAGSGEPSGTTPEGSAVTPPWRPAGAGMMDASLPSSIATGSGLACRWG